MVQANGIARGDEMAVSGFMVAACTRAFRVKTAACPSGSSRHSTDEFYWLRESVKIVLFADALPTNFSLTEHDKMTNTTQPAVELDGKDLPAHCPNPAMPLWSSHPRVFLEFNSHGVAKCPYCGTAYTLKAGASAGHH